jgi:hypothetical protein
MNNKADIFIHHLEHLSIELKLEINKTRTEVNSRFEILEFALDEINKMKFQVINNELPPNNARFPAFAWHVLDVPSVRDSTMGRKLLHLAEEWENL